MLLCLGLFFIFIGYLGMIRSDRLVQLSCAIVTSKWQAIWQVAATDRIPVA